MNVEAALDAVATLPRGIVLTASLTGISIAIATVGAIPLALMRTRPGILSVIVLCYTYTVRGTPLMVQLFLIYYGLGQLSVVRSSFAWPVLREPYACALLAFAINCTAHLTEIFRGAILAVPQGQIEAARSLGLSRPQTIILVVLPLATRTVLPAYANDVISMLKASSLASTITLLEITGLARELVSETFAPYEVFVVAAGYYLLLTLGMARLFRVIEARAALPGRRTSERKARRRSKTNITLTSPPLPS